jgi:hypothetical protein
MAGFWRPDEKDLLERTHRALGNSRDFTGPVGDPVLFVIEIADKSVRATLRRAALKTRHTYDW